MQKKLYSITKGLINGISFGTSIASILISYIIIKEEQRQRQMLDDKHMLDKKK